MIPKEAWNIWLIRKQMELEAGFDNAIVTRASQYVAPGEIKTGPDLDIRATTDDQFKVAIEVITHGSSLEAIRSRLIRLRQAQYQSVTWYLCDDAYKDGRITSFLWANVQEFYLLSAIPWSVEPGVSWQFRIVDGSPPYWYKPEKDGTFYKLTRKKTS